MKEWKKETPMFFDFLLTAAAHHKPGINEEDYPLSVCTAGAVLLKQIMFT